MSYSFLSTLNSSKMNVNVPVKICTLILRDEISSLVVSSGSNSWNFIIIINLTLEYQNSALSSRPLLSYSSLSPIYFCLFFLKQTFAYLHVFLQLLFPLNSPSNFSFDLSKLLSFTVLLMAISWFCSFFTEQLLLRIWDWTQDTLRIIFQWGVL